MEMLGTLRHLRKSVIFIQLHRTKCRILRNGSVQCAWKQPSTLEYNIRHYKRLPFEVVDTNVSRDVLLFKCERTVLFNALTIFGICAGVICTGLCFYIMAYVSDPAPENPSEDRWWLNNPLWRNKYRNGLLTMCFTCGCLMVGGVSFFSQRNIRYIWLLKGGDKVTFSTYGPFAVENKVTVPLRHMSCQTLRNDENKQLLLQVKGKRGWFAIDSKGSFPNPLLFDHTVGMERAIETK